MSLSKSKSKSFLTGVLLAILFATTGPAMALEGARLWKPYQSEEFGGKRREKDGVYASLEAIYWTITAPKGAYIGATTPDGQNEVRDYYTGSAIRQQTNSMNASAFDTEFKMGTRVEVGNRRGHHGWHFSGFGLPSSGSTISAENVNFVIRDEGDITMRAADLVTNGGFFSNSNLGGGVVTVWDSNAAFGSQLSNPNIPGTSTISGIGMLWGWFPIHYDPGPVFTEAVLAPVPITFHTMDVTNRTENWGVELSYTYRAHPFTWGGMELMAGARYWEFDDHFNINGAGPAWMSKQNIDDEEVSESWLYPTSANVNPYGPASLLATMTVEARALNRVIGPQVGAKFQRKNGRWTLGTEIRFMAGINNQTMRTQGYLGKNLAFNLDMGYYSNFGLEPTEDGSGSGGSDDIDLDDYVYPGAHNDSTILDQMWQQGVYPWLPVGMTGTGNYYNHKLNKTYFTPIVEWRLDADWQWTDAVSVNVGFNTTFADNIARAYRITDYKISNTEVFGIRGSRNASVLIYGVTFGLKVKR